MSEQVARLAVVTLRNNMFPALPQDIQGLFALISDPLVSGQDQVPNIVVGQYQDFGVGAATPMITVFCSGSAEGIVNQYRHLDLHVDIWLGGNAAPNVDGRRVVSVIYEYVFRTLQNTNWSGKAAGGSFVQIERSYEIERSPILFEPEGKVYHIANAYRVEALAKTWY